MHAVQVTFYLLIFFDSSKYHSFSMKTFSKVCQNIKIFLNSFKNLNHCTGATNAFNLRLCGLDLTPIYWNTFRSTSVVKIKWNDGLCLLYGTVRVQGRSWHSLENCPTTFSQVPTQTEHCWSLKDHGASQNREIIKQHKEPFTYTASIAT